MPDTRSTCGRSAISIIALDPCHGGLAAQDGSLVLARLTRKFNQCSQVALLRN